MSKTKVKKLTKKQRKQIEKSIKKNLNEVFKRNNKSLKKQLKETRESIDNLASEVDEDLQEHFIKHRNSVFVPMLDEATGEKTYEPRSFDEILAECENDKTVDDLTKYDHLYEMLDESSEHEWNTYYANNEGDLLEEDRWADREKELAAGGETAGHDAEGNPKSMGQRAKEKVKSGVEAVKSAWDKGKLYFFLKFVEQGLKMALAFSRGIQKLITRLVMGTIKKLIGAWIKTKSKVTELWAKIGAFMKEKLSPVIEKLIKPFLWIAEKMTGNVEKAMELAPILLNISVMSITLAYMYMSGGIDMFGAVNGGTAHAMNEVTASLSQEVATEMGCAAAAAAISETHLLKEEFACNIIDEAGEKLNNSLCMEVLKLASEDIHNRQTEVISTFESAQSSIQRFWQDDPTTWQAFLGEEGTKQWEENASEYMQFSQDNVSYAARMLEAVKQGVGKTQSELYGIDLEDMKTSWTDSHGSEYRGYLTGLINQAKKYTDLLPPATDQDISKAMEGTVFTRFIESTFESTQTEFTKEGKSEAYVNVYNHLKSTVTDMETELGYPISGGKTVDMGEVPFKEAKETRLDESQIKRLKKLAGIV